MPRDSHITVSPLDTMRSTVVFGSPGMKRPRTGARNSSTMLSRGPCVPAPGTPSTIGRQVASGCSVARMASSSPVLKCGRNRYQLFLRRARVTMGAHARVPLRARNATRA